MYPLIYMFVVAFVTVLLLALPLFPFWKVWIRIRRRHPDIWAAQGPFDILSLVSKGSTGRALWDVIVAAKDPQTVKGDKHLVYWARVAREVAGMMPKSFIGQIGAAIVFLYFVLFFSSLLVNIF